MTEPLSPPAAGHDIALSDVMLAMDVVDTLRHEQQLVSRALNEEARETELIERVRRAYASQGITVSEQMIVEGVAALKDNEYHYEPPAPGFKTSLLHAWVGRKRVAGGLGAIAIIAAVIGLAWYGFVEYPQNKRLQSDANQLNNRVIVASTDISTLDAQRKQLLRRWQQGQNETRPASLRSAFQALGVQIESQLEEARRKLETAATLEPQPSLNVKNLSARESTVRSALAEQARNLRETRRALTNAEQSINAAGRLGGLQTSLTTLRDEALDLSVEAATDNEIRTRYDTAISALRRGEPTTAVTVEGELREMIAALGQQYEVRIVSRPGALSGVIREPPNNRGASNYYLIVEAFDSRNQRVKLAIRSEEDGSTRTVDRWGVRVSEQTFNGVRRDKQDDGIVQNAEVGSKPRGVLDIQYDIATPGGFINQWEERW